jgi:hypothetical protein
MQLLFRQDMNQKISSRDRAEAEREREAREKGRSIPHYTAKVAKQLSSRGKRGKATPSKKA